MHTNKLITVAAVLFLIWIASLGMAKLLGSVGDFENQIAIVPITGVIVSDGEDMGLFGEALTVSTKVIETLEKLEKDERVKAIILEINSPGGTAVASKEIADKIKTLKKPTIALIREVGASGAYWVASSTNYIVADELSITGSIGVRSSYLEFSELFKKYGISYERLVAGDYKDAGSSYRKLTKAEKDMLQKKLDIIHKKFKDDVARNRNISAENMDKIANGMFYMGSEAYDLRLVDKMGNKEDAINKVKELAGVKEAKTIEIKERKSLLDALSRLMSSGFYYIGKGIGSSFTQNDFSIST